MNIFGWILVIVISFVVSYITRKPCHCCSCRTMQEMEDDMERNHKQWKDGK